MNEITQIRPTWITYRQAQTLTGLSRGTLWKIARAGAVPLSKHGHAARLHLASLEQYMWRNAEQAKPLQAQGPKD